MRASPSKGRAALLTYIRTKGEKRLTIVEAAEKMPGQERPSLLLTPTQLSTHLACPHYTQLERKRRAGELEIEFIPDPRLEAMRARGAEHEAAYIERLRHAGPSIVDLRESRDPQATTSPGKRSCFTSA